jgi:very-short-patch-repair endonuclease
MKKCDNLQCSNLTTGKRCFTCYHLSQKGKPKSAEHKAKISLALAGKSRPDQTGKNNVNYQNKQGNRPDVRKKYLEAVKKRGQSWSDEEKERHSKRMQGDSNWMRGKTHLSETKRRLSEIQSELWASGKFRPKRINLSKAEKEISDHLTQINVEHKTQFRIPSISYIYDFYIPNLNLIIEYNGNFWHCNPKKYQKDQIVKFPRQKQFRVQDIWARDKNKSEAAVERGYKFEVLWEDVYSSEGMNAVQAILDKY